MRKIAIALFLILFLAFSCFSGCIEEEEKNNKPIVEVTYPSYGDVVSNIVMISGLAHDKDGDNTIKYVEVMVNGSKWDKAEGTDKWSYDWRTYDLEDGVYYFRVRAWDGIDYSEICRLNVTIDNPDAMESGDHKWAIFIAAANFPLDNESKLGNGGLNFAENMAEYLIEECGYSTSKMYILFDDGWIRGDNGYGKRVETLQERNHFYDVNYGGATIENLETTIEYVVGEANKFGDSEVFIWFFGHGYGDESDPYTGGKVLESSAVFLWDDTITDKEFGDLLSSLKSKKTCVIVDACYSGGFADKSIFDFSTFFLLRSGIPENGRVVITGASKFRLGYASTTQGPLFSLLWLEGLKTGEADGYRSGVFNDGKPTKLGIYKDGKVSVEEAFYYASYNIRTNIEFEEFSRMEPQINDQYPRKGLLRSIKGLYLKE